MKLRIKIQFRSDSDSDCDHELILEVDESELEQLINSKLSNGSCGRILGVELEE